MPRTPTSVTFRGASRNFPTAKEAYVWLVDKFLSTRPDLLEDRQRRESIAAGWGRYYFGRSRAEMFQTSPHLAEDQNNYGRATGGWFVNLNISNDIKLEVLRRLASFAGLKEGEDWTWDDHSKHRVFRGVRVRGLEL
jgi:hypothetical protein